MTDVLTFFVPTATLEIQEFEYTKFAKLCKVAVPSASMRVYSIVFTHNGEVWHDSRRDNAWHQVLYTQVKGKEFQRSRVLSDPALVMVIFPGSIYHVVTNYRIANNVRSQWENPFLVGKPEQVTHFSNQTGI